MSCENCEELKFRRCLVVENGGFCTDIVDERKMEFHPAVVDIQ
jgi:hypothetical protein